jgi:pantothenate kinase type III
MLLAIAAGNTNVTLGMFDGGGHAHLIVKALRLVHESDEDLNLQGLRLIWERHRPGTAAKNK